VISAHADRSAEPARPLPVEAGAECERCGATALYWRNCKLICANCRSIMKSCADL
jgi:hypothetical protein